MICPKCKENTLEARFSRSTNYSGREVVSLHTYCVNWPQACDYYNVPVALDEIGSLEELLLKLFEPQIQAIVDKEYKG